MAAKVKNRNRRNDRFDRNDRSCHNCSMQTTLRIRDEIYRSAKAEAARQGVTLTRFIEDALQARIAGGHTADAEQAAECAERDRLMEALLQSTAHFRIGDRPTRDEMHER
jgi:hypothetical protein